MEKVETLTAQLDTSLRKGGLNAIAGRIVRMYFSESGSEGGGMNAETSGEGL